MNRLFQICSVVLLLGTISLTAQELPPPRPLSDTAQIRLIIQQIEQGVKQQDILQITDHFARTFQRGNRTMARHSLWDTLSAKFSQANRRQSDSTFQAMTPRGLQGLTSTWDYNINLDTLRFLNDKNAIVKITFTTLGAQSESADILGGGLGNGSHKVHFHKTGNEWRINKLINVTDRTPIND